MSNLCKTTLCSTVENNTSSIVAACDSTDVLFSAFSVDKIEPTNRISKVIFNDLPDASTFPNGHVVYIDDAKVPVIASNGTWIGFDGREVGSFASNCIFSWGSNACGSLGTGNTLLRNFPAREICSATDWCQVSAGGRGTAAIKTSGELWAWGYGCFGQLGDGTTVSKCSPVREICSATDWCQVSAREFRTAAIKISGELWAWGSNSCGALGDGTTANKCSPVREFCSATDWCQVSGGSRLHISAIKTSGELWSWGIGSYGRLGDGTTVSKCSPVREFCSATDWCQVSAGEIHAAAIKTSGQIWSWGSNSNRQLGDGTGTTRCSPVREFCSATDWCQVSAGCVHVLAIKTSGELWAWGNGLCGKLGDGTVTQSRCSPVREISSSTDWCQVSAGDGSSNTGHTAAIKTSGQLWAWGSSNCGQRGDGTVASVCSPIREFCSVTDWCQVSAGKFHTVALLSRSLVCR